MIRKLRIKFIFTVMLIITLTLMLMIGLFYIYTRQSVIKESLTALDYYSARSSETAFDSRFDKLLGSTDEVYPQYTVFILEYDSLLNIIRPYGIDDSLSQEGKQHLIDILSETLEKKSDTGVLNEYGLRYKLTYPGTSVKAVYIDTSYEDGIIRSSAFRIILFGAAGWFVFLIITVIISHFALSPVEKSWRQQQQLVADVSHELKTPVAVIRSNAEIISSHSDESVSEQSKWLGYISAEADRMTSLINNMLYLAKSEEVTSHAEMTDVDLSAVCGESVLPFESVCFEKGLTLEYDIEPDIHIKGNEDMLRQLAAIFTDNAVKYSYTGKTVLFTLKKQQDKAVMSVNNYGDVIAPEQASHIFERFYRADKARTAGNGYGLGLAIAKTIIDAHKGKVELSSGFTEGTTFTCTFRAL